MPSELLVALLQIAGPIALSGLTWLAAQLALWAKAKTGTQRAATAIMGLNDVIASAVTWASQTMVTVAKAKNGGKLTAEDGKAIKEAVLARIRLVYSPQGLMAAARSLGLAGDLTSAEKYISTKIESMVYAMENPGLPPFLAGPPPGVAYNQQPGQVQPDGSTSTGLPPFLAGPPPAAYQGVVPVPGVHK
jgi:hypothetical protein